MPSSPRLAIEQLRLFHFRNYQDQRIDLSHGLNVFTGANAQGKTNLLEAVATLALTRSPRASTLADLVQWGSTETRIDASITRPAGMQSVVIHLRTSSESGRVVRTQELDSKPCSAQRILGLCPVVLFWPEDLLLVKSGPEARRRLMDTVLTQINPSIANSLIRYRRALEQRNALLRQLRAGEGSMGAFAALSREVAASGAPIQVARARLVSELAPAAATAVSTISNARESLTLLYRANGSLSAQLGDVVGVEKELLATMETRWNEEMARGMSLVGPHRDDIDILLNDRPAKLSASQGQQRSIVLACKLAEVSYIADETGTQPVLLLDDVLSELDGVRQEFLFDMLALRPAGQVLLTTADATSHPALARSASTLFVVEAGVVHPPVGALGFVNQ